MILSRKEIIKKMDQGKIKIDPFNPDNLSVNSYDITLNKNLAVYTYGDKYDVHTFGDITLDCSKENEVEHVEIDDKHGYLLMPNILYLAVSNEYTESLDTVPFFNGKSSIGRLGIFTHVTAGWGDVGFCGNWTLEIVVVHPILVYANMPIGQIQWNAIQGEIEDYSKEAESKYSSKVNNPIPIASKLYNNKFFRNLRNKEVSK